MEATCGNGYAPVIIIAGMPHARDDDE